ANLNNGKEINEKSIYRIYSMSKLVTCVAALQLMERGDFLLTDPLSLYLSEFKDMTVLENGQIVQANREIRIKDLFTMTSGLTYGGEGTEVEKLTSKLMGEIRNKEAADGVSKLRALSIELAGNPL